MVSHFSSVSAFTLEIGTNSGQLNLTIDVEHLEFENCSVECGQHQQVVTWYLGLYLMNEMLGRSPYPCYQFAYTMELKAIMRRRNHHKDIEFVCKYNLS